MTDQEKKIKEIKKDLTIFIAEQQEKYDGLVGLVKTACKHKDTVSVALYSFRCDDVLGPLCKMKDILSKL